MKESFLFKFVSVFIAAVFVIIILFWIGAALVTYTVAGKAADQDWSGGIKPVIERLWCGEPGCLDK